MPVGIRLYTEPQTSQYKVSGEYIDTIWGRDMKDALVAAARQCLNWELAFSESDEAPDRTIYAYDCLGGLRFEARRRDRKLSIRKT